MPCVSGREDSRSCNNKDKQKIIEGVLCHFPALGNMRQRFLVHSEFINGTCVAKAEFNGIHTFKLQRRMIEPGVIIE